MIVKTLGIKSSNAYGRLISYIRREDAAFLDNDGNVYTIKHNTFGTPEQVEQQFKDNEAGRLSSSRRSNNNKLLHTILSMSVKDREHVTPEMLEHLSREYIRLLDPDALYYGTIHLGDEGKSPHAHILASSVNMMGVSTRQNSKDFEALKIELERITHERYPELLSHVEHGGHGKSKSDKEWQMEHAGRVSEKQRLQELVSASFELATTREEFYSLLRDDNDMEIYERGGEVKGIESNGRNYRFCTMGVDMEELVRREERYQELQGDEVREIEQDKEKVSEEKSIEQQRLDELENL